MPVQLPGAGRLLFPRFNAFFDDEKQRSDDQQGSGWRHALRRGENAALLVVAGAIEDADAASGPLLIG